MLGRAVLKPVAATETSLDRVAVARQAKGPAMLTTAQMSAQAPAAAFVVPGIDEQADAPEGEAEQAAADPVALGAREASHADAAHAPAPAVVRGSPQTVAHLSAEIARRLEAQTTRFQVELEPAGLGKVDVTVEIGAAGVLTAALNCDNVQAAEACCAAARASFRPRSSRPASTSPAASASPPAAPATASAEHTGRDGRGADHPVALAAALDEGARRPAAAAPAPAPAAWTSAYDPRLDPQRRDRARPGGDRADPRRRRQGARRARRRTRAKPAAVLAAQPAAQRRPPPTSAANQSTYVPLSGSATNANIAQAQASLNGDQQMFLKLLTAQLSNQDPLSPLDANQFTAQLVQMNGVQQQILTNQLLTQLVSNQGGLGGAVGLIGKQVQAATAAATHQGRQGRLDLFASTPRPPT